MSQDYRGSIRGRGRDSSSPLLPDRFWDLPSGCRGAVTTGSQLPKR